ncbi:outer membrane protein assembly factor BamA [Donghicola sp.]|jgi:outer membrane protein insertion porin family|uniref:outer membrane protein assembly factor BamA n=1 Tax=Donghicola sp. TaxID=1929294 RepID=UPI0025DD08C1|nr:outer membrane protein assembly factor BamA [Donghicola sp.]MCT4577368.1 outer membrane protein assembly factor BamA [Donghicola sp.]
MTEFPRRKAGGFAKAAGLMASVAVLSTFTSVVATPTVAVAQSFAFNSVEIDGNQRIEDATILSYMGIARGQTVSAAEVNAGFRRLEDSGLFESVDVQPRGNTLVINVVEYPTVNRISFEGNRRLDDDAISEIIESQERRVLNPSQVERDAARIAEAYSQQGRLAARVQPRIIRRSDNRIDLVYEVFEGDVSEIERISFVGNQAYSDRRLRGVLETKQAGLLRRLIRRDTYIEDRIAFDRQVLSDFYAARGYVDFRVLSVTPELTRERNGVFLNFNIEEGQQFRVGDVTVSSQLSNVDPDLFAEALRIESGDIYSPTLVENSIARLERLTVQQQLQFVRIEPRITRNDRDLTLDVEFVLSRGPRVFVERIDIEGNTTTLDRVIRREFTVVEGDPFNPREVRQAAERIRALGFFSEADVDAREGSSPDQVIVDVDVTEQPTGSISFGANYSTSDGVGLVGSFSERNFLGRGQSLRVSLGNSSNTSTAGIQFVEPAFLGRDLAFGLNLSYSNNTADFAEYSSNIGIFEPSLTFPVSENGRLQVRLKAEYGEMYDVDDEASVIIQNEADEDALEAGGAGYTYSYDTRTTGLNPNAGVFLSFGQDFMAGNDVQYVETNIRAQAQAFVLNEEVELRATFEASNLTFSQGSSRAFQRYYLGSRYMRGFEGGGIGPRDASEDAALGGNNFAVARFEAEFPIGLPEEYGVSGGVFYDIGSLWGLDKTYSADVRYEDFSLRQVAGVSIFWDTPIGPLRFNWSEPIERRAQDKPRTFEFTISAEF